MRTIPGSRLWIDSGTFCRRALPVCAQSDSTKGETAIDQHRPS